MDMTTLTETISTLGFPIAMCGALFWYMIQQNKSHSEESREMRDAISSLEKAIIQLTDKLGGA